MEGLSDLTKIANVENREAWTKVTGRLLGSLRAPVLTGIFLLMGSLKLYTSSRPMGVSWYNAMDASCRKASRVGGDVPPT